MNSRALYTLPRTIDDVITATVGRVLDLFDIEVPQVKRWGEDVDLRARKESPPKRMKRLSLFRGRQFEGVEIQ